MLNTGKVFEGDFKNSIPDYCLIQRLNDPPQSFVKSKNTKFSVKNPCDFLMFDSKHRYFYAFELKSTKYRSIGFQRLDDEKEKNAMIKKHQVKALTNFAKFKNVRAGLILNFRNEKELDDGFQRTYFIDINNYNTMCGSITKASFNEIDLLMYGAIKIQGKKKISHFKWDIDRFLKMFK